MSSFRFKRFEIGQERSAMKVNTDGVLLGAWMNILPTDTALLDIGTGTGVIALMAAQRLHDMTGFGETVQNEQADAIHIDAIDIDEGSVEDAMENFRKSPWYATVGLNARLYSLQKLAEEAPQKRYNLIFSNPPYFINSLKPANNNRSNSRHTDTLTQGELLKCVAQLLVPGGRVALVLPAAESELLLQKALFVAAHTKKGEPALHLSRICKVHTTKTKSPKRWLMEFVFSTSAPEIVEESALVMQDKEGYTEQYRSLTKEFYLRG